MPSAFTQGVGAAMLDFGWQAVFPVAVSWRCQSFLPVSASRQTTCSRSNRGPDAAVMNSLLPNTTGEATLRPGRSTFHLTFSVGLKFVGSPLTSATPAPSVPRNWGQLARPAPVAIRRAAIVSLKFMECRIRSGSGNEGGMTAVDSLARRHHFDRKGPAGGVADAELELPHLGPILGLVVLTHLDQDLVLPGLERSAADVLVEPLAVVVLLAGEDLLAVQEDLDGADAPEADLHRPLLVRLDGGEGIGHRVLVLAQRLVEVHDADFSHIHLGQFDLDRVRLPFHFGSVLPGVRGGQVHHFLRLVSLVEPGPLGAVERPGEHPFRDDAE